MEWQYLIAHILFSRWLKRIEQEISIVCQQQALAELIKPKPAPAPLREINVELVEADEIDHFYGGDAYNYYCPINRNPFKLKWRGL